MCKSILKKCHSCSKVMRIRNDDKCNPAYFLNEFEYLHRLIKININNN